MITKDYCKYVDVFYGNGEVDHFPEEGLASKWFYIKALCGNTTPHAVYPFGKMSAGAYSSAYPTGYGTHYPNTCGGIRKLWDCMKIRGFSHLHQSGTGAIGYYYNYAVVTPFFGEVDRITEYHEIRNECGRPGYYSVEFNEISCELTVNEDTAFHRYRFLKEGGRVAVDFSNDGLSKLFPEHYHGEVKEPCIEILSEGMVCFSGIFSGIRLCFCVKPEGHNVRCQDFKGADGTYGVVFDFDSREFALKVSYSTIDRQHAITQVSALEGSFEETAETAYEVWNRYLSAIEIETEDAAMTEKFYSNFYHSLIKPCDMTGETIMGIQGDLVGELATFWDQYKTLYPFIFTFYPEMGGKLVKGIANISRTHGKICCSLGLSDRFACEMQAKMLGILTLCDAYYSGIAEAKPGLIAECVKRELERDDFAAFLEEGIFERYTHILDATEACRVVADILKEIDDLSGIRKLREKLLVLAGNWVKAYGEDGLMSEASRYYEGCRHTYSFRLQNNMQERIAMAGGEERFVQLLDEFFGFEGESIAPVLEVEAYQKIGEIMQKYHRFEGFNNECDMETPYAYIYAGRQDRTCEIVHEAIHKTYTLGKGGLPGNNDSGGLSSCFLWNVLGLFPASGTGEFLLGSPHTDRTVLHLAGGNVLEIQALGRSDERYQVEKVEFNGKVISDFRIPVRDIMKGGKLTFRMK